MTPRGPSLPRPTARQTREHDDQRPRLASREGPSPFPASYSRRPAVEPVLLALSRVTVPPSVLVVDEFGSPSLRVVFDTVRDLPVVVAAQVWAAGDTARLALVRRTVAGLTSGLYATSSDGSLR